MAQKKDRGLPRELLERETRKLAADLAFFARSPVTIQLVGGSHIAFTYNANDKGKQHQIPIVMNPDTLKSVRNQEQAVKIWRGIGIHELAHHLFPAEAQYKLADKEGFRHLFNLVDDEQNERRARALDETWGSSLQAVCAHVFSNKRRSNDTLSPGIVDGEKEGRKPRGIAATKVYSQRWNQFAYHFRLHVTNPPDPIVAEALALVPKRFKDLTKEELLALTREIHNTLARGIEMPKPDPDAKPEEPEEPEEQEKKEPEKPEPDPKGGEDGKEAPDQEPDDKEARSDQGWSVRRLLTSKWMLIPFALFVTTWVVLLLQGGLSFWVQVAILCTFAAGAIITFLYLRRAFIKSLVASLKSRASPGGGASGARGSPAKPSLMDLLKTKAARTTFLAVAGAVALYVLYRFSAGMSFVVLGLVLEIGVILITLKFANNLRIKAGKDKKPISRVATIGIVAACVVAVGGLVFTLAALGLSHVLVASLAGVVAMLVMLALMVYMAKDKQNDAAGGYQRETFWKRLKRILREKAEDVWDAAGRGLRKFFGKIGRGLSWFFGWVARICKWVWHRVIVPASKFIAKWSVRGFWKVEPKLSKLWRHALFRLAVVSLPVAALIVMLYAVLFTAAKVSVWLLVVLILLLLLLLLLAFLFRKQIKQFVVNELLMPMPTLMDLAMQVPLDMETEWFVQVDNVVPVEPDQQKLDEMLPEIHILAQQLRPYLKRCGRQTVDREDQPDGYDLVDEAELALVGETSIFVNDDTVPKPSVHIEVALDCSSSMNSPTRSLKPGEKFLLGKKFALILEQAVINLPGVSAHFWGFTDSTIFDCGVPGEGRVSGLQCGGGNNDAAMLWHMGQSAAKRGKDVKILLMLSDGQPSECSWLALHNLVLQFEQEGMIPWNFALDVIQIPAFERFFTDLVGQTTEEAIVTMGETLASIAQDGV